MRRKFGAKVTHHCWCGKTGHCRKHSARCEKHQTDYYASGRCLSCEGEVGAADRRGHRERQDRRQAEEDVRNASIDSWYKMK